MRIWQAFAICMIGRRDSPKLGQFRAQTMETMSKRHQVAALPVRRRAADSIEVLLITSRETGRWVIPKGWPWPKLADHQAAAEEAWEEAGVRGRISRHRIGRFSYAKRQNGGCLQVEVSVFLLEVTKIVDDWPETRERRRKWVTPRQAAALVEEPELKDLLLACQMPDRKVARR